MMAGKGAVLGVLAAGLLLSACGGDSDGKLMNLRSPHDGPDEFAIMPTKPLQMPTDFASLPPPEPGARNLVDQVPLDDAILALGGRPGAGGGDQALVAAAGRNGVSPGIREDLAARDAAFREKNGPRLLERLFGTSAYYRVYGPDAMPPRPELERWRQAGARTPSAPEPEQRR